MKIEKLTVDGFGKLINSKIELRDGLNIVYGMNEAGKSTLQMFILAMFYGKLGNDQLKKYKPWQSEVNNFGGSISYKLGKDMFKIERDFNQTDELLSTKVINEISKKDITKEYYISGFEKLQILEKQIGMNQKALLNSIFLKQADIMNMEDLVEAFKKKLKNISESGEEDVSITQSIKLLEELKKNIGSDDTGNGQRANAYSRLNQSKKRLQDIMKFEKEVFLIQDEYEKKVAEANKIKEDIIGRERLLQIAKAGINKSNYEVVSTTELEKEDIRNNPDNYMNEENKKMLEKLRQEYSKYTLLTKNQEDLKNSINNISTELNSVRKSLENVDKERLNSVEINYINLCNEIANCKQQIQTSEVLVKDKKKVLIDIVKLGHFKKCCIIGAIVAIIILATVLGIYNRFGFLGYIVVLFCGLELFSLKKQCASQKARLSSEIDEIYSKKDYNYEILKLKEEEYEKLCSQMGGEPGKVFENIKSFRKLYQKETELDLKLRKASINLNAVQTEMEYQSKTVTGLIKECTGMNVDINSCGNVINNLFGEDVDIYGTKNNYFKKGQFVDNESKDNKNDGVVDESYSKTPVPTLNELDNLKNKLKKLEQEIELIDEKINIKLERINMYGVKNEIVEEINQCQSEYDEAKERFEAIDFAIRELIMAGKKIGEEYSKIIVSKISQRLNAITGGKYNYVKVDDNMNINAMNESNEIVHIYNMSSSAVDQFNFSYRVSMAEVLSNEKYHLPLILDEPFQKYDDKRLEEAINVLYTMSKSYQIIVFTCQKRDIDMTRAICQQKFNLVCI